MHIYRTREEYIEYLKQLGCNFSEDELQFLQLSDEEKSDPKTFEDFCKKYSGGLAIAYSSEEMRDNRELMLIAAKNRVTCNYYLMSERLRDDPEIALYAAKYGNNRDITCGYISKRLRDDPEFVFKAIQLNPNAFRYATVKSKTDPAVVRYMADNHPGYLQYLLDVRKELRDKILNDKSIILAVAKSSPKVLSWLFPKQYLDDPEVLETAFHLSDPVACKAILRKNTWALQYVPMDIWVDDERLIKHAIKEDGTCLRVLPEQYKTQIKYAKLAVSSNPYSLEFVSDELKNDKEFVLYALSASEDTEELLKFVSMQLRDDYDVVLKAVSTDALNLMYASDRLRDDKSIVKAALLRFGGVLDDASERLQSDPELIQIAIDNS